MTNKLENMKHPTEEQVSEDTVKKVIDRHAGLFEKLAQVEREERAGQYKNLTVYVESPYAVSVAADAGAHPKEAFRAHLHYVWALCQYVLENGGHPFASHMFYTALLNDSDPTQREQGIAAGQAFAKMAQVRLFGLDLGWSRGMLYGAELRPPHQPEDQVYLGQHWRLRYPLCEAQLDAMVVVFGTGAKS